MTEINPDKIAQTCFELCKTEVCKNSCCGIISIPNKIIIENIDKINPERIDRTENIKEFGDERTIITNDGYC